MTQKLLASSAAILFLLCAFGWGRLTRRWLDRRVFVFGSLTAISGLSLLAFIGGWLNWLHAATTPWLLALLAVGLGSAAHAVFQRRSGWRRPFARGSIPALLAPAIGLLAAWWLTPGDVFNVADDFHTYFTRTARMAQTGSLAGNAFDSLGVDGLGSFSFFHRALLLAGGFEISNGFDAVAAFSLCLLLLAEISLRCRMPWWLGVACLLGLVWFNPQYANISPLYAGAAGVMALLLCGVSLARSLLGPGAASATRLAVAMGLLAAWVVTLKVTFVPFVAIDLALLFLLLFALATRRRAVVESAAVLLATLLLGVMPWALVSLPDLLRVRDAAASWSFRAPLAAQYPVVGLHDLSPLFVNEALTYGDSAVLFVAVSAVTLALGIAGVARWLQRRAEARASGAIAVAAAGAALCATLLVNGLLYPVGLAIRYACPIAIGVVFASVLLFVRSQTPVRGPSRRRLAAGAALGCAALLLAFHATFLARLDAVRHSRTLLVYGAGPEDREYSRAVMSGRDADYHARIQSRIPEGATALVWTSTPFQFDFARNPLLTVTAPGISNPALRFPAGLSTGDLERFLLGIGVHFVILETRSHGEPELAGLLLMRRARSSIFRKIGDYGAYLRIGLDRLARRSKTVYADERMLVFELGGGSGADRQGPAASAASMRRLAMVSPHPR